MIMKVKIWDGPLSGVEFETPHHIHKIIIVTETSVTRYENDMIEIRHPDCTLRMVETRDVESFDEELMEEL